MTERDTEDDTRCDEWEPEDGPQGGPPNTQCLLEAGHPGGHVFDTVVTMVETPRIDEWRASRRPGWYKDVGYRLQQVLTSHVYDYKRKGVKPDDPGWHECSCGKWQGYWSAFAPHVADHLRASVVDWVEHSQ